MSINSPTRIGVNKNAELVKMLGEDKLVKKNVEKSNTRDVVFESIRKFFNANNKNTVVNLANQNESISVATQKPVTHTGIFYQIVT